MSEGFTEGFHEENRTRLKSTAPNAHPPSYPVEQRDGFKEGYIKGIKIETKEQNLSPVNIVIEPIVPNFPITGTGRLIFQVVKPLNTVNDGDLLTLDTFNVAPVTGAYVGLLVNGQTLVGASGASQQFTQAFYVTDPTNTIVRAQGAMIIGDLFHWNGSVAAWQIEATDQVQIIYTW